MEFEYTYKYDYYKSLCKEIYIRYRKKCFVYVQLKNKLKEKFDGHYDDIISWNSHLKESIHTQTGFSCRVCEANRRSNYKISSLAQEYEDKIFCLDKIKPKLKTLYKSLRVSERKMLQQIKKIDR